MEALDFEQCRRARMSRDGRFDGLFFTAVKTTQIYCRPICPARSPKEENVTYYPSAAAAAAAGFRPCLRCRPESAPGTPAWRGTEATVARAMNLIREGALEEASLADLADRLGISDRHLRSLFHRHLGVSPVAYAQTQRVLFAKQLLNETALSITDVALASGFGSIRRFNDVFLKIYGKPPSHYQRSNRAQTVATELNLSYRPPYDWPAMLAFFEKRRIPGVEHIEDGSYSRSFSLDDCEGAFRITHRPIEHAFKLEIRIDKMDRLMAVVARVRRLLDLDANMEAIHQVLQPDPLLGPLITQTPGLRLPGTFAPFEFALRAILGQQVSVAAATTLAARIAHRYGRQAPPSFAGITHYFPKPQALLAVDFQDLGVTRSRAATLVTMVRAVCDGSARLEVGESLDGFVEQLCALKGIGPWTAHYLAMRGLGEPDAFPESDLGVLKALGSNDKKATLAEVRKRTESWRPWRAYGAIHLWHSFSLPTQTSADKSLQGVHDVLQHDRQPTGSHFVSSRR